MNRAEGGMKGRTKGKITAGEPEEIRARVLLGLCTLALGAVVVWTAWLAGQLAGVFARGAWPDAGPGSAPSIVIRWVAHVGDPRAAWPAAARADVGGPVAVYAVLAVLLGAITGGLGWVVWRLRARIGGRRPGFASAADIDGLLSTEAVVAKAAVVRPSLAGRKGVEPGEVAYSLGREAGTRRPLWGLYEWSGLLVAAERMGKTMFYIVDRILGAPGAVITTSTRLDTLPVTHAARARLGPVYVFDPQHITSGMDRLRWSPVAGCADPLVAIQRSAGFVAGSGVAGKNVENGEFFAGMATAVLRAYLHAADLGGCTVRAVLEWSMNPDDRTPVSILRTHPDAAPMWADQLAELQASDPRLRGSVWAVVQRAFDAFADPRVLAGCDVASNEAFDAADFLRRKGTLYILGSRSSQISVAPLICAFIEDIVRVAQDLAQRSVGSRLDPPLSLVLDECTNIAPIPSLPNLMSDGGGKGITTIAAMQSRWQARARWEEAGAAAMWETCSVKLILGGLSDPADLGNLAEMSGQFDEYTPGDSYNEGRMTFSRSVRRVPVLERSDIRQLPVGHALLFTRNLPPIETVLTPWWEREDAKELAESRDAMYARMGIAGGVAG
ncbi:type IV secretory system conjugative DNA transfer family protein [Embleya sp. NPDC056575]|uniref:type IV secretory system conjugative DNA transfer family protein n=1 Tax=unclassified Embleya TaxID=2699296 RepID=UPI00367B1412